MSLTGHGHPGRTSVRELVFCCHGAHGAFATPVLPTRHAGAL